MKFIIVALSFVSSIAFAQSFPPGMPPRMPLPYPKPIVIPHPTRALPPMPTTPPQLPANQDDVSRRFPETTVKSESESELKYISCNLEDAAVKDVLRNCPKELAKLKREQVDRPVSVTCFQKYPDVVEYEFVFEACKSCRTKTAHLSVTVNSRSTYGSGAARYDAYLRID